MDNSMICFNFSVKVAKFQIQITSSWVISSIEVLTLLKHSNSCFASSSSIQNILLFLEEIMKPDKSLPFMVFMMKQSESMEMPIHGNTAQKSSIT